MDSTTRYTIWFYDSINRGLLNITAHILASSSSIPEPTAHITTLMLLVIFRVLQRASGRATWYLPCCPSRFRGSVLRTKRLHLSLFSTILGLDFTFLSFWNFLRLIITSIYPCVQLFWGLLFFSDGVATIHVVHPYSVPINALGGTRGATKPVKRCPVLSPPSAQVQQNRQWKNLAAWHVTWTQW